MWKGREEEGEAPNKNPACATTGKFNSATVASIGYAVDLRQAQPATYRLYVCVPGLPDFFWQNVAIRP